MVFSNSTDIMMRESLSCEGSNTINEGNRNLEYEGTDWLLYSHGFKQHHFFFLDTTAFLVPDLDEVEALAFFPAALA